MPKSLTYSQRCTRRTAMTRRHQKGETYAQIGATYKLSPQRVQKIIATEPHGGPLCTTCPYRNRGG